jgi:hypothetical protein
VIQAVEVQVIPALQVVTEVQVVQEVLVVLVVREVQVVPAVLEVALDISTPEILNYFKFLFILKKR